MRHWIKRLTLECFLGFLAVYVSVIVADVGLEALGLRTGMGSVNDWVLAALPVVVGAVEGAILVKYTSWRPTLTWPVPFLFALINLYRMRSSDLVAWLSSAFGPNCENTECLGRLFYAWPLLSTVTLTLVIAFGGRLSLRRA
jgi:hypothetical protein